MKRVATLYRGLVIGIADWTGSPTASGVDYAIIDDELIDVGWVYDDNLKFFDPYEENY